MNKTAISACAALTALALHAGIWRGLEEGNYYSGPKVTEADLAGKVVLVDQWGVNCPPCRALLPAMQKLWNANKSKPFVLLGSHCQGRAPREVQELVDANKLTYPIYDFAGLVQEPDNGGGLPFMYVVDHRGKVVYAGRSHGEAESAVAAALQAVDAPPSLCAGVPLQFFKAMAKQLVLGKSIKGQVKALKAAEKRGEAKNATAVQRKQAEEAKAILAAIDEAKDEIKAEIDQLSEKDPAKALALAKGFIATFPEDAADYKAGLADLSARAKDAKKSQK